MSTQSLEERKMLYSQELAAYTLQQWTAVRRAIEIQSTETAITNALGGVDLGSPDPNGHTNFRTPRTRAGRSSSVSGATNYHTRSRNTRENDESSVETREAARH
ncbi:hypothetical protein BS17DRAFT_771633 [Gyrodon lividus]|nr:hypothetical protein BS17DRAFT_771633 [Gyrodon lividus]